MKSPWANQEWPGQHRHEAYAAVARKLIILTYHRVLPAADSLRPDEISVDEFSGQMGVLARFFNTLPLLEGIQRLCDGSLPPRACCVTFDDGYADNSANALPVLKCHGITATLFVATGYLDGGRMWNDTVIEAVRRVSGSTLDLRDLGLSHYQTDGDAQRLATIETLLSEIKYRQPQERERLVAALAERVDAELPADLMLTTDQLRKLPGEGMEIGGHTVSHPILKELEDSDARQEIELGKKQLEELLGNPVLAFAYPNGQPGVDYLPVHADMVKEAGFSCAVSTAHGAATASDDILQLPRFGPWGESPVRFAARLMRLAYG